MSYSIIGAVAGLVLVLTGVAIAFRVRSRRVEIIGFFVGLFAIPTYLGDLADRQAAKLQEMRTAAEAEARAERRSERFSRELREASASLLEAVVK